MPRFNVIILCFLCCFSLSINSIYACDSKKTTVKVEVTEGNLKLHQLIAASKQLAASTPNKFVNKTITGEIVTIDGKKYEIRYFSFEDTANKLNKNITFAEYAKNNKLIEMQSTGMDPLPGIHFESFDYRKMKLNDGVYFSMALRLIVDTNPTS